ncbi:hypothetical protein B296_00050681 [Ensete ventricosum]|uniref:Uncharacterized protein n=1 Tax=Ensete ventricosum TaxID=4639 RepID=A0A426XNE3_ENSVE|nr:hypothetical protein B296_00050681 [Ensete ventricosum]
MVTALLVGLVICSTRCRVCRIIIVAIGATSFPMIPGGSYGSRRRCCLTGSRVTCTARYRGPRLWRPKKGPRLFIRRHRYQPLSLRLTCSTVARRRLWRVGAERGMWIPAVILLVVAGTVNAAHLAAAGPFPAKLNLERALPTRGVGVELLKARDRARHGRSLLGASFTPAGVVDFPVDGSSNPFTVGYSYSCGFGAEFDVSGTEFRLLLWFC